MILIEEFRNLNYIAIAIATLASYVLGFVWYHWAVFGEAWANALGISKEQAENTEGLGSAFIVSLVSGLAKAFFMAMLVMSANISGVLAGGVFGAAIAMVFTGASLAYYNGFARTPPKLTLINASHSIVELAVIGAIIGAFA